MKRILVFNVAPRPKANLNTFVALFSHQICDALDSRSDVAIEFDHVPLSLVQRNKRTELIAHFRQIPSNKYDHIVSLGLRAFTRFPPGSYEILKEKVKAGGNICQFYDGALQDRVPGDITFTLKIPPNDHSSTRVVEWAADPAEYQLNQPTDTLNIFVDHPHYSPSKMHSDYTNKILFRLKELYDSGTWKKQFNNFCVYRLTNSGIAVESLDDVHAGYLTTHTLPYNRKHVSHVDLVRLLSSTHLFIPTHPESLGLTVLEAAMGGNHIVAQPGLLPADRMSTISHTFVDFNDVVQWEDVLSNINPRQHSKHAKTYSYDKLVNNMLTHLDIA